MLLQHDFFRLRGCTYSRMQPRQERTNHQLYLRQEPSFYLRRVGRRLRSTWYLVQELPWDIASPDLQSSRPVTLSHLPLSDSCYRRIQCQPHRTLCSDTQIRQPWYLDLRRDHPVECSRSRAFTKPWEWLIQWCHHFQSFLEKQLQSNLHCTSAYRICLKCEAELSSEDKSAPNQDIGLLDAVCRYGWSSRISCQVHFLLQWWFW